MNTSKTDAIKKAYELKAIGHTNKTIVKQLAEMGYYNPRTLKPWTKGMLQRRLADFTSESNNDSIARKEAIRLRENGYKIKHVVLALEADGFINLRTNKPFGLYNVNQWLVGIQPLAIAKAKAITKELNASGLYPIKIVKVLTEMGFVNLDTGKPYGQTTIIRWLEK